MIIRLASKYSPARAAAVDRFFSCDVHAFTRCLKTADRLADEDELPKAVGIWFELTEAIQESEAACRRFEDQYGADPSLLEDVQEQFRMVTAPWYDRSWFARRARTKPS